jgi:hypothetical protein
VTPPVMKAGVLIVSKQRAKVQVSVVPACCSAAYHTAGYLDDVELSIRYVGYTCPGCIVRPVPPILGFCFHLLGQNNPALL